MLWERGYVGTSPKAILAHSGAGQGSMYHHFKGKADLAVAAIARSADELIADIEASLSIEGTAYERIASFLLRQRDILKGCRIGRLAQDPDVMATTALHQPVADVFVLLQRRLVEVLELGRARGEFKDGLNAEQTAACLAAVLQGGYVLARAAHDEAPFHQAVNGVLAMLAFQLRGEEEAS